MLCRRPSNHRQGYIIWEICKVVLVRWVSVVKFHDPTSGIGKVFGQESTVVKWNYQILGLHQVTVRQKLGVILVIKWFKNWSQQKMLFTKKVLLNWYSSMIFFFRKIRMKIHFESPKLTLFDKLSPDGDSKSGTFHLTTDSWFLAKNLAYAGCRIMKFHYWNSSNAHHHSQHFTNWMVMHVG